MTEPHQGHNSTPTPQAARVLIVDDDAALRHAVARALAAAGYATDEATNGQQAIERYRAAPADLVLLDLYMPGTDGVETIIRLRSEFPGARIIATSGGGHLGKEDVLDRAARLGVQATLPKPVGAKQLLDLVRQVLGSG